MARYAEPSDLMIQKDQNILADLCQDDGKAPDRSSLADNAILEAMLDQASGVVESALIAGRRYSATDLEDLTGNSQALLKRICCDIGMRFLYERRPDYDPDALEKHRDLAERYLQRLQKGEDVFNITANKNAGLVDTAEPTTTDYSKLNLIPDRCNRFFPARQTRLPTDRS